VPRPADLARWPLTGRQAPDVESTRIRPVAVKVENSPQSRPQTALELADVVYETVTEGGITRFNAIYHSQTPEAVGPVRSARLSDLYVVPQYRAFFAHVGANDSVMARIRDSSIEDVDQYFSETPYWRSNDRPRPHNMYVDIEEIRSVGVAKGFAESADPPTLAFDLRAEAGTVTVSKVLIPFDATNKVTWEYDQRSNRYLRQVNGQVHTDALSGDQLSARNVVVLWARTSPVATRDATGAQTLDIVLTGEGRVTVLRDGRRLDGTWTADEDSPPEFESNDGERIRLAPGNTWFQVIPTSASITLE
jgi:hypothetical protein